MHKYEHVLYECVTAPPSSLSAEHILLPLPPPLAHSAAFLLKRSLAHTFVGHVHWPLIDGVHGAPFPSPPPPPEHTPKTHTHRVRPLPPT